MKQQWIRSPLFDSIWFLAPTIVPVLTVVLFPAFFREQATQLSPAMWVVLILLVDVAHVYSTVYRTYCNAKARKQYATLLRVVPLAVWAVGIALFAINPLLFWRCLAYMAVFHFVRQQYGFLRLYSRGSAMPHWIQVLHTASIYAVTLLPIAIWHVTGPKNFNWFVEGDFLYYPMPAFATACTVLFAAVLLAYGASEFYLWRTQRQYAIGRIALVLGTAASWYIGIVVCNGDLAFTMLNVLAHGIPYMALVWVREKSTAHTSNSKAFALVFGNYGVFLFFAVIAAMGYVEEALWDVWIWREHGNIFGVFAWLQPLYHHSLAVVVVPLLSLPQATHYVLDGFIWKSGAKPQP